MADRWALAFTCCALLALAGAWLLRRAARRPGSATDLRRMGGGVLVLALAGWAFAPGLSTRLVVLAVAMLGMAVVGLMVDRGILRGPSVLLAIVTVSVLPVAVGVGFDLLGVPGPDAVVSVLWIAGVTAAVAGLGNTDGLLGTVVVFAAAGVVALSGFAGQDALATVGAALAGAAVGFLAYNTLPASLFVGQVGGLVAGVVLAVAALEVQPGIAAPESHLVPVLLLGLLITDAVVVALGRLAYRRPLTTRRPDHLPHRLRALGWSAGRVTVVLGAVQVVLSGLAVFVGRGVLHPAIGATAALGLLAVLVFVAVHGRVYRERRQGLGLAFLVASGLGLLVLGAAVPSVLAGLAARRSLEHARNVAELAISAARRGEPDVAAAKFRQAAALFQEARDHMYDPTVLPGLVVPGLGSNVHAMRTLSDAGLDLARAGERLTAPVDPEKLRVRNGTIDLVEVKRIAPSLAEAARLLSKTSERVDDLDPSLLLDPVRDALREVRDKLARAQRDAVRGAAAARVAPALLGGEGTRHYFLAVQNPAELRATGGFIGSWGILTAENGKVSLEFIDRTRALNLGGNPAARALTGPPEYLRRYSRFEPERTWQNVNMSPDFPVVARVISELYPQSGGEKIDGVLAVDPQGLAALLVLTGPVRVEGWPDPITADNVVDITLRDAYQVFANTPARADFLGDVARKTVDVATSGDLGRPARIAKVLGRASRAGHISLYFTRPNEEAIAKILNTDGAVPRTRDDSLLVVTQNAGANKIDYYLRRQVHYAMQLDPDASGRSARVRGSIAVQLDNTAPASGLPQSVIGPAEGLEDRFVAGENFTYLSMYTPLKVNSLARDGAPTKFDTSTELGRNVFSAWVSIGAQTATSLAFEVDGTVPLERGGWYELELVRQPHLGTDAVTFDIEVPPGWQIGRTVEATRTGERTARVELALAETTSVRVQILPSEGLSLWYRLRHGT